MSSSATADLGGLPELQNLQLTVLVAHSPLAVEVDPLTGEVRIDDRLSGLSAADQAACEWALRLGDAWSVPVRALTVGPPAADATLRGALAAGAATATRVATDADADADADPRMVAAGVLAALRRGGAHGQPARRDIVLAGTWSPRRGSGAVPALVAAGLGHDPEAGEELGSAAGRGSGGAAQALGLLSLIPTAPGVIEAERRLDGGRRERLRVRAPAVLSVDPGTATLRRAGLRAVVAARRAPIEVLRVALGQAPPTTGLPLRPRPKVLLPPDQTLPARDRVLRLTGAGESRGTGRTAVRLDPPEAADRIHAALRGWGYLPADDPGADGPAPRARNADEQPR
ncbi:hypothetical protein [Frankia sp. CiP3]|uniref:hypothetical protein n=1 Tax=Frankia sp. CiP3 TaxID=2880971 RepID=UPI001EF4CBF0|nr:hypothetical protein [Frankia sp. CiP3]